MRPLTSPLSSIATSASAPGCTSSVLPFLRYSLPPRRRLSTTRTCGPARQQPLVGCIAKHLSTTRTCGLARQHSLVG
eukprot:212980-Chlamydomonas_euryale.AAC.1